MLRWVAALSRGCLAAMGTPYLYAGHNLSKSVNRRAGVRSHPGSTSLRPGGRRLSFALTSSTIGLAGTWTWPAADEIKVMDRSSLVTLNPAARNKAATAPLIIGHRGAAGYRPEHTLASYELAARMGADYIEPDLVSTKDHVLVARHENEIEGTTDVASHREFAARRITKTIDGQAVTGWFTEDFTLAELKTLRAKERLPAVRHGNTMYDGRFEIPTFAEILALRDRLTHELHRVVGVYPETKHPTYFRSIGLDLESPLVEEVRGWGLDKKIAPIFIQSFELSNLVDLRRQFGVKARLIFLTSDSGAPYDLASTADPTTYAELCTAAGLRSLSGIVDGIGPDKCQIIPCGVNGTLASTTMLVADAHAVGLKVHPYTFRAENAFLPFDYRIGTDVTAIGRAIDEQTRFLATGIDGLFTDQADIGVIARAGFIAAKSAA
jgi:glycerophosphoryl diester phosphodiesterase